MLILDGHESHVLAEFDNCCEDNKIIPIYLPSHSSHLAQPLKVGYFSPLIRAYGDEINKFSMVAINILQRTSFLLRSRPHTFKAITVNNT